MELDATDFCTSATSNNNISSTCQLPSTEDTESDNGDPPNAADAPDASTNAMPATSRRSRRFFHAAAKCLVQVIKEGIGTKGPTLSTYISIPGRYLVLMPGLQRVGVSRKINDEEARKKLRDSLNELAPPEGLGFIIRTAGIDRTKKDLQRDMNYLLRLWRTIVRRIRKTNTPVDIYEESGHDHSHHS